ncbi:MAG: site-specific integrase [Bryobacterales bacterium]|nr:site-specific integrase [Bryobacterales bacterium]
MRALKADVQSLRTSTRSEATRRAYATDWREFTAWCGAAGRASLPADPETVSLFTAHELKAGRKLATVNRRLAAIAYEHKQHGHKSPVTEDVRSVVAGAKRKRGDDTTAKAALTVAHLKLICRKLPRTRMGVRDRALLLVGFASGMRRSELSALNVADVHVVKQGVRVMIKRSKTDQEGRGREIGIFCGKAKLSCPVTALQQWLYLRGKRPGPLFVGLGPRDEISGERLSAHAINDVVKRCVELAGLDPAGYGAHSLRAGCVTAAAESGVPESLIMKRTGHKSLAMVQRYVRPASAFSFNVLAKAL